MESNASRAVYINQASLFYWKLTDLSTLFPSSQTSGIALIFVGIGQGVLFAGTWDTIWSANLYLKFISNMVAFQGQVKSFLYCLNVYARKRVEVHDVKNQKG